MSEKKEWSQWEDLPPEEEEKLIQAMAKYLIDHKLDTMFLMVIQSGGPLTTMFSEFWMGLYGPYLDFFGVDKYMALMRKRKNVEKLINMLEKVQDEKKEKKKPKDVKPQV